MTERIRGVTVEDDKIVGSQGGSIIGKGPSIKAFSVAIRGINTELMKKLKDGRRAYFSKLDARHVFDKFNGRCAFCALNLNVAGNKLNSVHLMMYSPLAAGGEIHRDNLIPVCSQCKTSQSPGPKRPMERIPNVNTIADIVDRLVVEVNKLAWFENKKREEHAKDYPDVNMIAEWDNLSRDCCEFRSLLKRELNAAVVEFVQTFQYKTLKEARTFRPPKIVEDENTVGDIVAEMCMNVAEHTFENPEEPPRDLECNDEKKEELTEVLRGVRATKQYKILRNRKDL